MAAAASVRAPGARPRGQDTQQELPLSAQPLRSSQRSHRAGEAALAALPLTERACRPPSAAIPPKAAPLPGGQAGDEPSEGAGTGREGKGPPAGCAEPEPSRRGGAGGPRGSVRAGVGPGGAAQGALPAPPRSLPGRAGGGAAPIGRGAAAAPPAGAARRGEGEREEEEEEGAGLRCAASPERSLAAAGAAARGAQQPEPAGRRQPRPPALPPLASFFVRRAGAAPIHGHGRQEEPDQVSGGAGAGGERR